MSVSFCKYRCCGGVKGFPTVLRFLVGCCGGCSTCASHWMVSIINHKHCRLIRGNRHQASVWYSQADYTWGRRLQYTCPHHLPQESSYWLGVGSSYFHLQILLACSGCSFPVCVLYVLRRGEPTRKERTPDMSRGRRSLHRTGKCGKRHLANCSSVSSWCDARVPPRKSTQTCHALRPA